MTAPQIFIDVAISGGGIVGTPDGMGFEDDVTADDVIAEMQAEGSRLTVVQSWSLVEEDDLLITVRVQRADGTSSRAEW